MDGILLVDKPEGWTSHDVVAKVRSILRSNGVKKPKVGHTGTLDPLATGLLVLTLGTYCKRAAEFTKLDKTYEVGLTLGEVSTTGDSEGEKRKISSQKPYLQQIETCALQFTGEIMQTPPVYSALKVNGHRAYKLARAGKEVKLEPRTVKIYKIEKVNYEYPALSFVCKVSSGTYIRSLAEDIGKELGTGAYMSSLRRLSVGTFGLGQALNIERLSAEQIYDNLVLV